MEDRNYILDRTTAEKKLIRIAYEIAERNSDASELVLAGIKENGLIIANKLLSILREIFPITVMVVAIEMDKRNPGEVIVTPTLDIRGKVLIIVDDVANSGKTLTYSMKPFLNQVPQKIQTVILVERTHKAYPITADYVGLSIATTLQDHIIVEVEQNIITGAYLI